MTQNTPVQGLIEWHRRELYQWQRIRAYEVDHDQHVGHTDENVAFHTEAISTLTRMEAEVGRLREALEKIEKTPAWGAPDFWQVTPSDVRQLARAALNPQEPTHAD